MNSSVSSHFYQYYPPSAIMFDHFHYLWVFLPLHIFCHIWVKVLRISFIQAVDFPLLLNLHISIHQDELTNCLESNANARDE